MWISVLLIPNIVALFVWCWFWVWLSYQFVKLTWKIHWNWDFAMFFFRGAVSGTLSTWLGLLYLQVMKPRYVIMKCSKLKELSYRPPICFMCCIRSCLHFHLMLLVCAPCFCIFCLWIIEILQFLVKLQVMMNAMNVPSKRSTLERKLDKLILALFATLFMMCLIGAISRYENMLFCNLIMYFPLMVILPVEFLF